MKKLILTIKEFLQFRQICEKFKILFTYGYKSGGTVVITADAYLLETIGY